MWKRWGTKPGLSLIKIVIINYRILHQKRAQIAHLPKMVIFCEIADIPFFVLFLYLVLIQNLKKSLCWIVR